MFVEKTIFLGNQNGVQRQKMHFIFEFRAKREVNYKTYEKLQLPPVIIGKEIGFVILLRRI